MQETRRAGRTCFTAAVFRIFCSGSETGRQHGVGIAVKESICCSSTYATYYVDEHLMAMRFEVKGQREAVNSVAAYAPTDSSTPETKQVFWNRLNNLIERIPRKECVYVLKDANSRTGRKIDGERSLEGVPGAHRCDELNDNGTLLLSFAECNKRALTNTFTSTRKQTRSFAHRQRGREKR